ncbi:hypothetical protein H920_18686 [Fukomys damarensis]|uniref:Uncharacterized protein n=1 Tax=Fukomys damarensis TaxID=885580 RepID=A0A091CM19_FUKDA|nr:hypothetical protein H920_18686 [Fukomys damarensis]
MRGSEVNMNSGGNRSALDTHPGGSGRLRWRGLQRQMPWGFRNGLEISELWEPERILQGISGLRTPQPPPLWGLGSAGVGSECGQRVWTAGVDSECGQRVWTAGVDTIQSVPLREALGEDGGEAAAGALLSVDEDAGGIRLGCILTAASPPAPSRRRLGSLVTLRPVISENL